MTSTTLRLRPLSKRSYEPAAWFLTGESAADWLAEILRWNVDQQNLRLCPVPGSAANRKPIGALVVAPKDFRADRSPHCLPYGVLANQLCLPVDAELFPPVDEADLKALLAPERTYIFHPVSGLIGFDSDQFLSIASFLEPLDLRESLWTTAVTGVVHPTRLLSLRGQTPESIEELIDKGRDDISSIAPSELLRLPKPSGEGGSTPLHQAGRMLAAGFLLSVQGVLNALARLGGKLLPPAGERQPSQNSTRGFADENGTRFGGLPAVRQWLSDKIEQLTSAVERARHLEVERLMRMMEKDPDEGLKYAISFREERSRQGPRGASLTTRNVDYSGVSSHGYSDNWGMPDRYRYELIAKYREAANRELRLGRHRRAAYIFAELLGDYSAAASALRAGRFWLEAAEIYRKKLNKDEAAAECLVEGGLIYEAILIYISLRKFETAGDLSRKIGQEADAQRYYQQAVQRFVDLQKWRDAAELLTVKLNQQEEALEMFETGWSHGSKPCLTRKFEILAEAGRDAEAEARLRKFRNEALLPDRLVDALELCSWLAVSYSSAEVRDSARDETRVLASRALQLIPRESAQRVFSALRASTPQDRLLNRDCVRFVQNPTRQKTLGNPSQQGFYTVLKLSGQIQWKAAVRTCDAFVLCGFGKKMIFFQRFNLAGESEEVTISQMHVFPSHRPVLLECDPNNPDVAYMHVLGRSPIPRQQLFREGLISKRFLSLQSVGGERSEVLGLTITPGNFVWTIELRNGMLTVVTRTSQGETIGTRSVLTEDLTRWQHSLPGMPIPFWIAGKSILLAMADQLYVIGDNATTSVPLPTAPRNICGIQNSSFNGIAIGQSVGAFVFSPTTNASAVIGRDVFNTQCAFISGGRLVIAGCGRIEIYGGRSTKSLMPTNWTTRPNTEVKKILAYSNDDRFAIWDEEDNIEFYDAFQMPVLLGRGR